MGTTSFGSSTGGGLSAELVDQPPANATIINSTNPKIRNATTVQDILAEAAEDGIAARDLNESQLEYLEQEFEDVPYTKNGTDGYYIRYEDVVILLEIVEDG